MLSPSAQSRFGPWLILFWARVWRLLKLLCSLWDKSSSHTFSMLVQVSAYSRTSRDSKIVLGLSCTVSGPHCAFWFLSAYRTDLLSEQFNRLDGGLDNISRAINKLYNNLVREEYAGKQAELDKCLEKLESKESALLAWRKELIKKLQSAGIPSKGWRTA